MAQSSSLVPRSLHRPAATETTGSGCSPFAPRDRQPIRSDLVPDGLLSRSCRQAYSGRRRDELESLGYEFRMLASGAVVALEEESGTDRPPASTYKLLF